MSRPQLAMALTLLLLVGCRNGSGAITIARQPLQTASGATVVPAPTLLADGMTSAQARALATSLDRALRQRYPAKASPEAACLQATLSTYDAKAATAVVEVTIHAPRTALPTHRQVFTVHRPGGALDHAALVRSVVARVDERLPAETEPLVAPRPRPASVADAAARRALQQSVDLLARNLVAEAADRLADLATRHPDEAMIAYTLGLAADAAGRRPEARSAYTRAAAGINDARWGRFAARRAAELDE